MTTNMNEVIAHRAVDFITACENGGLTYDQALQVLNFARMQIFEHPSFQSHIRRQQVINKVSTTCDRLRRERAGEHQEGEINNDFSRR